VERIRRSGFGFGGVNPRVAVHPERPGPDRSDRCRPLLGFARVNVLVSSLDSGFATVLSLECFGAREVDLLDLEFPGLDRSDR
jgi:hypothetical protein